MNPEEPKEPIETFDRYQEYTDRLLGYKMANLAKRDPDDQMRYYLWLEIVDDCLTHKYNNILFKPAYLPFYIWYNNGVSAEEAADWAIWHYRKCVELGLS